MACSKCDFKGYIEDIFFANNRQNTHIRRCPYCNDEEAYSKHIQKTYSSTFVSPNSASYSEYVKNNFGRNVTPQTNIIQFPSSVLAQNQNIATDTPENVINFIEYKKKYDKRLSPLFPENHNATILEFKRK